MNVKFKPQQIKTLLPILTAFAEGKTIQRWNGVGVWFDSCVVTLDSPAECYRIKPDPIILKYRRYIWKDPNGWHITSLSSLSGISSINVENMEEFVRWIDNDWITYECEV